MAKKPTCMVQSWCKSCLLLSTALIFTLPSHAVLTKSERTNGLQQESKHVATARLLSGVVKDDLGVTLPGVEIQVKNTSRGMVTDLDGAFSIKVSPGEVLVFRYLGYRSQEVEIKNQQKLDVTLMEDTKALEEVVVIGYGKMEKGDLSAAVSSVANIDRMKERPIANAAEMLQGQIPGVTVVANGGHPDASPKITIRGMGSRGNEAPLYVVDGVPGAPFNFSDVESMTVLKDAASAAIYGAYAGSAGVILVTTKQATEGKPSVEYNMVTGFSKAYNLPQSLTIEEQREVRAMALGGEENLPDGWDPMKNPYIAETRTDWVDEIFRTAPFQRHNVAVSAGTKEFSNRASFEYADRQGTLLDTYNKSLIGRLNSSWNIGKYVRVREDITYQEINTRGTNTSSSESGVILSALTMPRNAEVYNADGSFGGTAPSDPDYIQEYGSNFADIHGDVINPVRTLTGNYNYNRRRTFTSSTFLDIKEPIKGLNFTSRFTYKYENYFQRSFSTRRLEPGKPSDNNALTYINNQTPQWDFENTLTYDRVFGKHNVGLMASTTVNEYSYRSFSATGRDFENEDEALMYFAQAGSFDNPKDHYQSDRNISYVGRASYSYADRYFVTGSLRRDYAGRLPDGKKYGDFPSATLAWKISSEPFMADLKRLDLLKVRASWGEVGNLGSIGYAYGYPSLSNYVLGGGDIGSQIGSDNPFLVGIYNNTAYNPHLTWETSEQLDLGLDLSMFSSRLNLTVDYFYKKTKDLIKSQDAGWSNSIGIKPMLINEGEIHNSGVELALGWADQVGAVSYWVSGNMATLKNRVHSMGAADNKGNKPIWTDGGGFRYLEPFRTEEGQSLYSYYLIQSDGVFKSQAEIDAHINQNGELIQPDAQVGDLKFLDENGNGTIDAGDKVYMGNAMPKLTYTLSGGLNWKDFNFSMMLQGVEGVKVFNGFKSMTLSESIGSFNRSNEILKALHGPNNEVPRISASDPNGNFSTESDYYLESGDYLRIKNITLGYSFTKLLQKNGYFSDRKSTLDVTVSVDNVATFTQYSGMDPEVGGNGVDGGQYPVPTTYSIGVRLKF